MDNKTQLRLDDCSHCACVTTLVGYTVERAIADLETGRLGCWNCLEDQEGDEADGHVACVVLYEGDTVLQDGRCQNG